MSVFSHSEFDSHEVVAYHSDSRTGLRAIIAVHNTNLGKGLGGCRMWPYGSDDEALTDVLRLSRGMTYKAALAGLPLGGGKSVIIGDPRTGKTPELIRAMGRFVNRIGGAYIVAEDSGTGVADIRLMAQETKFVGGLADEKTAAEGRTGDPSPATALGVYFGIRAAVRHRLGRDDLQGVRVAIQGVGNVGYRLARHLHENGAELWIADTHLPSVERCVRELGATAVSPEQLFNLDVDVLAPCALGAVLNDATVTQIKAPIVAGAANNQLARPAHDAALLGKDILYAPDYVINAGGIIDIFYERPGYQWAIVEAHLRKIGTTLTHIFERSTREGLPTGQIADGMAEEIFRSA